MLYVRFSSWTFPVICGVYKSTDYAARCLFQPLRLGPVQSALHIGLVLRHRVSVFCLEYLQFFLATHSTSTLYSSFICHDMCTRTDSLLSMPDQHMIGLGVRSVSL